MAYARGLPWSCWGIPPLSFVVRLLGLCVGLLGVCVGVCPGCYPLAWVHGCKCEWFCIVFVLHALGVCLSVCGRVYSRVFLCGLVLACLGLVPL
jgi:hypothetical protein